MSPPRIMIVEDERITAEDIHDILVQLGYTITAVVSTGVDAIGEAERTRPDLILMDISIKGDIDGVEAAFLIRERYNIPVVYLTAHTDRATLDRAKRAEPLGYLVKPFQESALQASIEMAVHKHQSEQRRYGRNDLAAATIRSMGEAVIATDLQGIIGLMNPAAESRTGWNLSDSSSAHIDQVLQLRGRDRASTLLSQVIKMGALCELPTDSILVTLKGELQRIGGTMSPVRDHNGDPIGATIVFGDEQAEEPEKARQSPSDRAEPAASIVVGESLGIQKLKHFARRVAGSEVSIILLRGESGTGKDVFARYLHQQSRRADQPMMSINCAAIPETLMESELFGYEKGAFTDARAQKKGILEMANGGTAFLDEIGEMPISLQAKMLRVMEDQVIRRLGGTSDIKIDIRVIAATNRDLRQAIQDGLFRLDLYYRLNVIQLMIPPLREHPEDILPLANYFIARYNTKFKRNINGISPEAAQVLYQHDWPGNVRELKNAIERAMVMEESLWITPASLALGDDPNQALMDPGGDAAETSRSNLAPPHGLSLEDAEKLMIYNALQSTGWNQTRSAEVLSITRDTLRYKVKKYGLRRSE